MKIVCIGGGPAGLYFALLYKKARPDAQITVVERNAPGVTFGWGVVFSDETLSYLEENDVPTHQAITKSFAHWTAIDVHYRGTCLRSDGHGFSGISRKELLAILQARCEELGVKLMFETEVDNHEEIVERLGGADLVIAGDGVKSKIRERFASEFKPSIDLRKARYIWLGTKKTFDAFTFYFEENQHGMFQVHAYRFDKDTSTFIVECDEDSFFAAGLDKKTTEESIAYLEELFGKHLKGEKLLPNKSQWVQFPTIKNEHWSYIPKKGAPVILMGDAVHTAHYSIGSGTKLAMEDSIALVKALLSTSDVREALSLYETERRPIVERIQKAAQDSLLWFENVKRYRDLEPTQFTFSLLTRSKRITYDNLKLRDPAFAERVRSWHEHRTPGAKAGAPAMFTPLQLRELTLANRVVVSPMCMYSAVDGLPNDFHYTHYLARAMGGAGLVMCEMTDVSREGRISPGCAGMYLPEHKEAWTKIVKAVHAQTEAKIGLQLGHAGRKASTKLMWEGSDRPLDAGNWPIISASPLPYFPDSQVPREMNRDDMDQVKADFVRSTHWADEAGFDLLELHMAHGYLLASFLSPLTNIRKDAYGGSREGRMRYPLEVLEAVRAAWPKHKPLSVRISATDWLPGGIQDEDVLVLAHALKERAVDLIDCSAGMTTPDSRPKFYGRMYQAYWSDMVRNDMKIPTMTVGNISSADQINTLILSGRADLCALARPHLANPHFTLNAAIEQGWRDVFIPNQYGIVRPLPGPRPPEIRI